jgi:hypothetical protein
MNTPRRLTMGDLEAIKFEGWAKIAVIGVGAMSAVISFQALRWIGSLVGMSPALSWLFPAAIDGVAIVASAATIALHDQPLRLRSYLWSVFGFFLAVSVVGNGLHAIQFAPAGTILSAQPWAIAGIAALPPLAVALTVHLYIVLIRHGRLSQQRAPQPAPAPRAQAQAQPEPVHTPERATAQAHAARAQARAARHPVVWEPAHTPAPAREATPDREAAYQEYARSRLATGTEWVGREVAEACGVERSRGSRIRDTWRARFTAEHPDAPAAKAERIHSVV